MKQIKKRFIPIMIVLQILLMHLTCGSLDPPILSECAVKLNNYYDSIHTNTQLFNLVETGTGTIFVLGNAGTIYEKTTMPTASVDASASETVAKPNSQSASSYGRSIDDGYTPQQRWISQILLSNTEESKKNIASFYDVVTTRTTEGLEMNLLLGTNSFLRIDRAQWQQIEDLNNANQGVHSDGYFVAIGNDEIYWNTIPIQTHESPWNGNITAEESLRKVIVLPGDTIANDKFVVIGQQGTIMLGTKDTTGTTESPSYDLTWETIDLTDLTEANLIDITYADDTLFAIGESGTILSSTDGLIWTLQNEITDLHLNDIHYIESRELLIIAANEGTILTKKDSETTWQVKPQEIFEASSEATQPNILEIAHASESLIFSISNNDFDLIGTITTDSDDESEEQNPIIFSSVRTRSRDFRGDQSFRIISAQGAFYTIRTSQPGIYSIAPSNVQNETYQYSWQRETDALLNPPCSDAN